LFISNFLLEPIKKLQEVSHILNEANEMKTEWKALKNQMLGKFKENMLDESTRQNFGKIKEQVEEGAVIENFLEKFRKK